MIIIPKKRKRDNEDRNFIFANFGVSGGIATNQRSNDSKISLLIYLTFSTPKVEISFF